MPGSPAKSPVGEFFIFYYPRFTIFLIKSLIPARKRLLLRGNRNNKGNRRRLHVGKEKGNIKFSDYNMSWRKKSEKFSLSQSVKLHLQFSEE